MAENGYIKQTWRISHIDVCPQHHTMLEPSLDSDHRRCKLRDLYWRLNDPDFRSRNVVPAAYSAAEWQIFYSIWPWLGSRCAIEPNALAISVFVAALLKRLAYASRDRSISTRHVPLWTQISQWIQSSNLRICTSVSGVDRLFQQLHSSLHQAVAYRFLKEVTAAEKVQRSIIATLPLSRWLAQLEFTLYAAPGTLTKVGMQAADGLPLHEVVNELDISSAKLRFLLEILGTEPFMTVRARHRHLRMFSPKDANSLKAAAADICMRKEAVTHLHLNHPRPLLPVLCRTGHLRRVQAGHHEFYLRSQMNELLRNLSRHAARFEGQTSLSLHDPLLYKAVDGIAVDELLADICAGRVDVWHDQTAAGLKSLRVPWSVR
ncbi:MAG: hypothetical protein ACN6OP_22720, partial [Pseudomonadales bacterium]